VLAFWFGIEKTGGVLGSSEPDRELLDAGALCGHLVAPGSVEGFLAEHRQRLFPEALFADLFPSGRGRPSIPGEVIATVMVLQSLQGLSDREAARELRTNIAWKVAAGLSLADEGFDPTVLVYWRNRLRTSAHPERIFDAVREVVAECGVLARRTARVLDSTVLDDAVLRQDTVMQLAAQLRKTARLIPQVAGLALSGPSTETTGKPICDWDDPADVEALVSRLVNTAVDVVEAVEGTGLNGEQGDAIGLLWLLCGQDVEPGSRPGTWRIAEGTARDRVVSVHDPDARHVHKTTSDYRDGYKAHVAVEPETGIITAATLTAGNVADAHAAPELLSGEDGPRTVFGDSAYGTGELREHLATTGHATVIKPPVVRPAIPGGFTVDDFDIDTCAGTVTCPAGWTVTIRASGTASFARHCSRCPLRRRCTNARAGRVIRLHPDHDRLHYARRQAEDPDFWTAYTTTRPMGERSISWLVADGCRKVRYRRLERNRHWLRLRCAALNLKRLITLGLGHDGGHWTLAPT
jgi:IS5 family transposase